MKENKFTKLSDEELLQAASRHKSTNVYDAVIFGVLIGIAIYSTVKNGWGLLTFLPLVYLPIAARNKTKQKELEKLLRERNLK